MVCGPAMPVAQGAGHQGNRGRLFEESVAFMDELRAALQSHRFAFLYENVEMSAEAAKVSSEALGVQPVFVCSWDFGWVSRPRLWWLSIDWTRLWSGRRRAGGIVFGWLRPGPRLTPSTWAVWPFIRPWPRGESSCLAPRRRPRPTTGGPSRGRPEAGPLEMQTPGGWRAVANSPHGTTQWRPCSRIHIPLSEVKEQLHHIPPGYTAKAGADAKTRHRMVGNGWHWGVASRLLGLLVMTTWAKPGHYSLAVPVLDSSGLGLRAPPPGQLLRSWARA